MSVLTGSSTVLCKQNALQQLTAQHSLCDRRVASMSVVLSRNS
jgi:serine/threonine protein phosphatase PrpC